MLQRDIGYKMLQRDTRDRMLQRDIGYKMLQET
jgi:hypothetical protein